MPDRQLAWTMGNDWRSEDDRGAHCPIPAHRVNVNASRDAEPVQVGAPRLRGLYAITPDLADTGRLLASVEPVLAGGAVLLQYRNKVADAALAEAQARALLPLCQRYRVPLVVNDDAALAARIGAAGVHLGRDDDDVAAARRLLGSAALVGVSCYADLWRARAAVGASASYVAFGAFHPSPTKPAATRAAPSLLAEARGLGVPMVAIGGITLDNAGPLIDCGADLVAVISDLFDHSEPGRRAAEYAALFGRHANSTPDTREPQ